MTDRQRLGVLLVNLGTPDAPTPAAVRRYLAEFLWDPRVVEIPRPLWWLILNGFVLPTRPAKSAHAYAQIWTEQGSPLLVQSQALASRLRERLQPEWGDNIAVELGMTYGSPSIANALRTLRTRNIARLLVLPLYPQYSGSTTGSVFDRVVAELATWRAMPDLRFVTQYYSQPLFVQALANSVREYWGSHARKHLVFSFHGIPQSYVDAGDPYFAQCRTTAQSVTQLLQLAESEWSIAFQSRLGRAKWLQPYTDRLLKDYGKNGPKQVCVICPAFAVDCVETLEEIAIRNRADFIAAGGESFDYIPALNARPDHIEMFAQLVRQASF